MKFSNTAALIALTALTAIASHTHGDVVSQWNFNSTVPDANNATGVTTPSTGIGTASLLAPVTGAFGNGDANGGSTDPVTGDDSGWQTTGYAAQGVGSGTAGVQFNVSTVGYENIIVSWDQRHSNTSSRYLQLQYSLDGSSFSAAGLLNDGIFEGTAGDTWFNNRTVDLSTIVGASNNANFAVRIVAIFAPTTSAYAASNSTGTYAASGTWRFDMVTVSGTAVPAPGAFALLGVAGLTAARRRRRA